MNIRKIVAAMALVTASIIAAPSYADICGIGKITEVREGLNNRDNLVIRLDTSTGDGDRAFHEGIADDHIGTLLRNRFIRFQASSLTPDRLKSIRALAYLALVSGKSVYVWTHNANGSVNADGSFDGGCSDATELSIFNEGINPK